MAEGGSGNLDVGVNVQMQQLDALLEKISKAAIAGERGITINTNIVTGGGQGGTGAGGPSAVGQSASISPIRGPQNSINGRLSTGFQPAPGQGWDRVSGSGEGRQTRGSLSGQDFIAPYYQPGKGYGPSATDLPEDAWTGGGGNLPPGFSAGGIGMSGLASDGNDWVAYGKADQFRGLRAKARGAGQKAYDTYQYKEDVMDEADQFKAVGRGATGLDESSLSPRSRERLSDMRDKNRRTYDRDAQEVKAKAQEHFNPKEDEYQNYLQNTPYTNPMSRAQYDRQQYDEKQYSRMIAEGEVDHPAPKSFLQKMLPGLADPAQFAKGFGKGALYALGTSASDYFATQTHAIETGRIDPIAQARQPGMLAGGLIGAGVGALFGGFGGIIGGSIGGQVGGMLGEYIGSYNVRDMRLAQGSQQSSANLDYMFQDNIRLGNHEEYVNIPGRGGTSSGYHHNINGFTNPALSGSRVIGDRIRQLNEELKASYSHQYPDDAERDLMLPSHEEQVASYSTIVSSMISAGQDPSKQVRYNRLNSHINLGPVANDIIHGGRPTISSPMETVSDTADRAMVMMRDAGIRYGNAQKDVIKQIAPILSSSTKTGDNVFDILNQFGPEATARYEELNTPIGEHVVSDEGTLRNMTLSLQRSARNKSVNQYGVRGVAASQYAEDKSVMGEIDRIAIGPNGENKMPGLYQSETYQKMKAEMRNDLIASQEEAQVTRFGIPMARLEGEAARNRVLPFSPGNSYKNSLQTLALLGAEVKTRTSELNNLRSSGQLTEREELRRVQELEQLSTAGASRIADLQDGMIDRLPAFSAGRPSGFHSYDSLQLAQMQLAKVGHPSRYFGALNGKDAAFQDSFARGFAVPGTDRPYSQSSALDMAPYFERMLNALTAIANNTQSGTGAGTRATENRGNNAASQQTSQTRQVPQRSGVN